MVTSLQKDKAEKYPLLTDSYAQLLVDTLATTHESTHVKQEVAPITVLNTIITVKH